MMPLPGLAGPIAPAHCGTSTTRSRSQSRNRSERNPDPPILRLDPNVEMALAERG